MRGKALATRYKPNKSSQEPSKELAKGNITDIGNNSKDSVESHKYLYKKILKKWDQKATLALFGGVEIRDVEVAAITSEVTIYREEATPEKKYNNNQDMA